MKRIAVFLILFTLCCYLPVVHSSDDPVLTLVQENGAATPGVNNDPVELLSIHRHNIDTDIDTDILDVEAYEHYHRNLRYEFPPWWDRIVVDFTTISNLQRCIKRTFAPVNGTGCSTKPKTCFFGTQACPGGVPYPEVECFCNGSYTAKGNWMCTPVDCPPGTDSPSTQPSTIGPTTFPSIQPSAPPTESPSTKPSSSPTNAPSAEPSSSPSKAPVLGIPDDSVGGSTLSPSPLDPEEESVIFGMVAPTDPPSTSKSPSTAPSTFGPVAPTVAPSSAPSDSQMPSTGPTISASPTNATSRHPSTSHTPSTAPTTMQFTTPTSNIDVESSAAPFGQISIGVSAPFELPSSFNMNNVEEGATP